MISCCGGFDQDDERERSRAGASPLRAQENPAAGLIESWAGMAATPAWRSLPQILQAMLQEGPLTARRLQAMDDHADLLGALRQQPGAEWDGEGNLVGLGLTSRPTHHRLLLRGKVWYTWCALDTLVFPGLLGERATVWGRCAATAAPVRLEVAPTGLEAWSPRAAVVSMVAPGDLSDVRASFCSKTHFFVSAAAAKPWLDKHPEGFTLPLQEAHAVGQAIARQLSAEPASGPESRDPRSGTAARAGTPRVTTR